MNRSFYLTIVVSLLIHLLVFMPWQGLPVSKPMVEPEQTQKIEISLLPPEPPAQIEPLAQQEPEAKEEPEDVPPPSRHLEDDITKANTSDGSGEEAGGQRSKATKKGLSEPQETEITEQAKPGSPTTAEKNLKALQGIFGQEVEVSSSNDEKTQNELSEVEDDILNDSNVENPLNELEEEKARWFNEVLKRITEQISYIWIKPDGISRNAWGVIRMNLDSQGYLLSAWVHLPSGSRALDDSALLAIRGVIRYQIPESVKLSRYYRNIEFQYHGG